MRSDARLDVVTTLVPPLVGTFESVADAFEAANPGVTVNLNLFESSAYQDRMPLALLCAASLALPSCGEQTGSAETQQTAAKPACAAGAFEAGTFVTLPAGSYLKGADPLYPEEAPSMRLSVEGFAVQSHEVTNDQFARFVASTGYRTVAEHAPQAEDFPGADPALLVPGAAVFVRPEGPVTLEDSLQWWRYVPGAQWRHPEGPGSSIEGRGNLPVVHVAYADAEAYARWAGDDARFAWEIGVGKGLDGKPITGV